MNVRALAIVAVALAGAAGAGIAQARDRNDVQFSVTIGHPGLVGWAQPVHDFHGYRPEVRFDRDRDGIPNRYDRNDGQWNDRDHDRRGNGHHGR